MGNTLAPVVIAPPGIAMPALAEEAGAGSFDLPLMTSGWRSPPADKSASRKSLTITGNRLRGERFSATPSACTNLTITNNLLLSQ
jgi:hypothetical protein